MAFLARASFNFLLFIWLAVLVFWVDIPGTIINQGASMSDIDSIELMLDIYLFKLVLDVVFIVWTIGMLTFSGNIVSTVKMTRDGLKNQPKTFIVKKLNVIEPVYFAAMAVYGIVNVYFHYQVSPFSTGEIPFMTLIWIFSDLAIAALCAVQFVQMIQVKLVRVLTEL